MREEIGIITEEAQFSSQCVQILEGNCQLSRESPEETKLEGGQFTTLRRFGLQGFHQSL